MLKQATFEDFRSYEHAIINTTCEKGGIIQFKDNNNIDKSRPESCTCSAILPSQAKYKEVLIRRKHLHG